MKTYQEMKMKHQKEINAFPMFFAFSEKDFKDGMKSFGLNLTDKDKVCKIKSIGAYIRKNDEDTLDELFERHEIELKKQLKMIKLEMILFMICLTVNLEIMNIHMI